MSVFKEADPSSLYVLTYAMLMLSKPVSPIFRKNIEIRIEYELYYAKLQNTACHLVNKHFYTVIK